MNFRAYLLTFMVLAPSTRVAMPNIAIHLLKEFALNAATPNVEQGSVAFVDLIAKRALAQMSPQMQKQIAIPGIQGILETTDKRHNLYRSLGLNQRFTAFLENTAGTFAQHLMIHVLINTTRQYLFGHRSPRQSNWLSLLIGVAFGSPSSDKKKQATPSIEERSCSLQKSLYAIAVLAFVRACMYEGSMRSVEGIRNHIIGPSLQL